MNLCGITRIFVCFQWLHKLMHRSNRNSKHPPPPGITRAFDCASCPGRGKFERCLGRVENFDPREFKQANLQKFKYLGVAWGVRGMLKLRLDGYIKFKEKYGFLMG